MSEIAYYPLSDIIIELASRCDSCIIIMRKPEKIGNDVKEECFAKIKSLDEAIGLAEKFKLTVLLGSNQL